MTFGIIGNAAKSALHDVLKTLLTQLKANNLDFLLHDGLAEIVQASDLSNIVDRLSLVSEDELPRQSDMVIALGGDGTMLYAARIVGDEETPILGINLGKLGFLAEVSITEIGGCIKDIADGKYNVEDRMTIAATTSVDNCRYVGLNEIVIDRGESARVIEVETFVNGDYLVTYAADGLIVTTPTGSTAYSLASGGPIVDPKSQVLTINPISPHSLTARPVIVPDDSIIRVVVHSGAKPIHITADGQVERFYETPAEFTIQKAAHVVKLVKRKKRTYFDLLRTKLMWGKDFRMELGK